MRTGLGGGVGCVMQCWLYHPMSFHIRAAIVYQLLFVNVTRYVIAQYIFPLHIDRLEEDGTAKDVLLLTEKQAHEATRKTLVEAQERNEELLMKIHDNDKNILQLQFTIQRYMMVS